MRILAIKDNKPGHYHQTEGLILALKLLYPDARIEYLDVKLRSKWHRWALRIILNILPNFLITPKRLSWLSYFYSQYRLPKQKPNLIVSTGGNTAALNAWFSLTYRCPNILNGKLRGLRASLFSCVTTVIDLNYPRQIVLDVAPTPFTRKKLQIEAHAFSKKYTIPPRTYALLLGGDGAGYHYDRGFYDALAAMMHRIAKEEGIMWLVTTSRRTPVEAEDFLQKCTKSICTAFVAYHKTPQKVVAAYLGLADVCFVTEESSSMISEAIAAQKPVFTLVPSDAKPDKHHQIIINKFLSKKRIKRIKLPHDISIRYHPEDFIPLEDEIHQRIATQLKKKEFTCLSPVKKS